MAIDKIVVVGRHRRELGDIATLAESIRRSGLFHPIVVTPEGKLLAGQRRLQACRSLGWRDVPVTIVSNLADASAALMIEGDENTCREEMRPGEKATLGLALEQLERPKAEARQREHGGTAPGRTNNTFGESPKVYPHHVRDLVAAAVGLSGQTYHRAKVVIKASQDPSLSDEARAVAVDARRKMDETGKVAASYNAVAAVTGRKPHGLTPKPQTSNGAAAPRTKTYSGRKAPEAVRNGIAHLSGFVGALENFAASDATPTAEEAVEWECELTRAISVFSRFRRQLKEYRNGQE